MTAASPENAYPRPRTARIAWVLQRSGIYQLSGQGLGVPQGQADALAAAGIEADEAQKAYEQARSRTTGLGGVARAKAAKMDRLAGGVIGNVRGHAAASPDPAAIFSTAEVAPRQASAPQGPPAVPAAVSVSLNANGTFSLDWKTSGAGVSYELERRTLDADGLATEWIRLPDPASRPATVPGVPAGTASTDFRVRALRTSQRSAWSVTASLQFIATPATANALRLAGSQDDLAAAA